MPGLTAQNLTTHGEAHAPKNHCNYGWGGRSKGAQQTLEPTAKPQEQREGISSTPHGGGTQVSQAWLNRCIFTLCQDVSPTCTAVSMTCTAVSIT